MSTDTRICCGGGDGGGGVEWLMELVGMSLRFEVYLLCVVVVLVESQEVQRETGFGWTASWRFDGGQRKYKSNPTENGWMVAGIMS